MQAITPTYILKKTQKLYKRRKGKLSRGSERLKMAAGREVQRQHIEHTSQESGFSKDFEVSILERYPHYFELMGEDRKQKMNM
jgi:hypothetical protein